MVYDFIKDRKSGQLLRGLASLLPPDQISHGPWYGSDFSEARIRLRKNR
jgi:hypothetical protein